MAKHIVAQRRTPAQLRRHYVVERELADRLRHAPREQRPRLYQQVYDELFERLPDHPQLVRRSCADDAALRRQKVDEQLRFLKRFLGPDIAFAEIGAGDCALSLRAAALAGRVHAIDVSRQVTAGVTPPANFELALTDGPRIPLPGESVHFIFSDQLMEHLHPEDAAEQVLDICRALAPAGRYLCITPNRLYGPSDISAHFDTVATGLHLKEYSAGELRRLFLDHGFAAVHFYAGARGRFVRMPYAAIAALEAVLEALPHRWRRGLRKFAPLRAVLGVRALAIKSP